MSYNRPLKMDPPRGPRGSGGWLPLIDEPRGACYIHSSINRVRDGYVYTSHTNGECRNRDNKFHPHTRLPNSSLRQGRLGGRQPTRPASQGTSPMRADPQAPDYSQRHEQRPVPPSPSMPRRTRDDRHDQPPQTDGPTRKHARPSTPPIKQEEASPRPDPAQLGPTGKRRKTSVASNTQIKAENTSILENRPLNQMNGIWQEASAPSLLPRPRSVKRKPDIAYYEPNGKATQAENTVYYSTKPLSQYWQSIRSKHSEDAALDSTMSEIQTFSDPVRRYAPPKLVAVLGPTGHGKSTLVGKLINKPDAVAPNGFARGTDVPQEMRSGVPGQDTDMLVSPQFLDEASLENFVCSRVCKIVEFVKKHMPHEHSPEEVEEPGDLMMEQYESNVRRLLSLVHESENTDFANLESFKAWIREQACEDDGVKTLHRMILRRAQVTMIPKLRDSTYPVSDAEGMAQILHKLRRPQDTVEPHPWPLLQINRIHAKDQELAEAGVIVSDTPGHNDVDSELNESTEAYLETCDVMLLVHQVLRSDGFEELGHYLELAMSSGRPIWLIITKADSPVEKAEILDYQTRMGENDPKLLAVGKIRKRIEECDNEVQELESQKQQMGPTDPNYGIVDQKLIQAQGKLSLTEQEQIRLERGIRESNVRYHFQRKMAVLQPGREATVPIFFTSAIEPGGNRANRSNARTKTDSEYSGIPQIQRKLFGLTGRARFAVLRQNTASLRSRLEALKGLVYQSGLERRQDAIKSDLKKALKSGLNRASDSLKTNFVALVIQHWDALQKQEGARWAEATFRLVEQWGALQPKTHTAYCKKAGHWSPVQLRRSARQHQSSQVDGSWNRQVQSLLLDDTNATMEKLQQDVHGLLESTISSFGADVLMEVRKTLAEVSSSGENINIQALVDFIALQEEQFSKLFEELINDGQSHENDLYSMIQRIHALIVFNSTEASYIGQAMKNTYNQAAQIDSKSNFKRGELKGTRPQKARALRNNIISMRLSGVDSKTPVSERIRNFRFLPGMNTAIKKDLKAKAKFRFDLFDRELSLPKQLIEDKIDLVFGASQSDATRMSAADAHAVQEHCNYALKQVDHADGLLRECAEWEAGLAEAMRVG
ncbi:hypothetical protein AC578_791 [Pseudocercospora eumusae]|uniref:G domain-containing protein n=1 Tax=Pseudocercospora eumusae TaxID=321146 RepID=A0A139HC22_9PEZI|nr:hypothetical protein AC578_791 [Pseudocercospora eumusae]